jgi:hypothetical protein
MSDDELRNLDELAALPPDDPRVLGLDARTHARLRAYREFLSPGDHAPRVGEAEDRLQQALEREIGATSSPAEHRVRAEAQDAEGSDRAFLRGMFAPLLRFAFAGVLLLIAAGGAWWLTARRESGEPVMRGPAANAPGVAGETHTTRLAGGVLRLEWAPLPEAQRYTVVFLAPDLTELARVGDLADRRLDLRPGALPAGLTSGHAVLWRALAMRGPDEVGRTRTSSVTLP